MALTGSLCAQNKGQTSLALDFQLQFSGKTLELGKQLYHSPTGDSLYLDALRFYVSGIQLKGKNGAYAEKESYHLLDAEQAASLSIALKNVPPGRFDSLVFWVGTDSLINVSGAMGGDLDPTLGMYWAWNSGYINLKLEGRSNSCNNRYHSFEFHIGGYMPPHQTVRRVALPINHWPVLGNSMDIQVELSKFFANFNLNTFNQVMIPSAKAAQMADFFKGVFSVR